MEGVPIKILGRATWNIYFILSESQLMLQVL